MNPFPYKMIIIAYHNFIVMRHTVTATLYLIVHNNGVTEEANGSLKVR
jgi:hypothetical protein